MKMFIFKLACLLNILCLTSENERCSFDRVLICFTVPSLFPFYLSVCQIHDLY